MKKSDASDADNDDEDKMAMVMLLMMVMVMVMVMLTPNPSTESPLLVSAMVHESKSVVAVAERLGASLQGCLRCQGTILRTLLESANLNVAF